MKEQVKLIVSEPEGSLEVLKTGTYPAQCISVIDLGTQKVTFQEQVKEVHKVRISWELDKLPGEERARVLGKEYTLSTHPKAELRKDLKTWREQDLTEAEKKAFNVFELVGKYAKLMVEQETSKSGGIYSNITGVLSGMGLDFTAENEIFAYSIENYDPELWAFIPEFIQKKIEAAPEHVPF